MDSKSKTFEIGGESVYLERGICYFFEKDNFERLLYASKQAKLEGKKFYVGLYSDELLKRTGMELVPGVTEEDRIKLVEALDFVDGAIIINSRKREDIRTRLENKILKQKLDRVKQDVNYGMSEEPKKYEVVFATGGFDGFHKGHLEHIQEMVAEGKTVIIAANSDRLLTSGYKKKKLINDQDTRRLILSHIRGVDIAMITDEYDKLKNVEMIRNLTGSAFDAIYAGSDWKGDPRWDEFEKKFAEFGIDVVFTDRPKEDNKKYVSTSNIRTFRDTRRKTPPADPEGSAKWRKQLQKERKKIDEELEDR